MVIIKRIKKEAYPRITTATSQIVILVLYILMKPYLVRDNN